jgi:1,4-alpha-glucan branching enzyme
MDGKSTSPRLTARATAIPYPTNGRLLYGYQYAHPGKKLLFMGSEIGQWQEWNEARSLDWFLLDPIYNNGRHIMLQQYLADLGGLYQNETALHEVDDSWEGFTWLDAQNNQNSILAFARHNRDKSETIVVVCNFTPVVRHNYRLGVEAPGTYVEILNSDAEKYGGSNVVNSQPMHSSDMPWFSQPHSIEMTLPPLAVIYLKLETRYGK